MESGITRHQGLLFGHAGLVAVVGLVSGFFLGFSVLGRIELWPLFTSEVAIPGEVRAWRAAHVGCLMNALLCGFGAVALPFVAAGGARVFVVYGLVGAQMGWVLRPFIGSPDQPFELLRSIDSNFFSDVLESLRDLLS